MTDAVQTSDHRDGNRCPLFVEVEVQDRTGVYFYRARNISAGGVFIDAPVPLEEGMEVTLHFRLPGGTAVEVVGQVMWTTKMAGVPVPYPGMGVAFRRLTDEARDAIQKYVSTFGAALK